MPIVFLGRKASESQLLVWVLFCGSRIAISDMGGAERSLDRFLIEWISCTLLKDLRALSQGWSVIGKLRVIVSVSICFG